MTKTEWVIVVASILLVLLVATLIVLEFPNGIRTWRRRR
jgi:hypothetical protein